MQANTILGEVDHQDADVRVLPDVPKGGHDAIPAVLRVRHGRIIQYPEKTGWAGPEGAVALAATVRRSEEEHLLAGQELLHPWIEPVQYLIVVETFGATGRAQLMLDLVLAMASGPACPFIVIQRSS
ncbi:hypothetical protein GCM10027074_70300 [Streptomyces deserti]